MFLTRSFYTRVLHHGMLLPPTRSITTCASIPSPSRHTPVCDFSEVRRSLAREKDPVSVSVCTETLFEKFEALEDRVTAQDLEIANLQRQIDALIDALRHLREEQHQSRWYKFRK